MLKIISKFLPAAKFSSFAIWGLIFAAGSASGGWAVYKWAQAQEVGRVTAIMVQKDKAATAAINALDSYYKAREGIDRTVIKRIIKYVPTDSVCNVSDAERRMLNASRLDLSEATESPDKIDSRSTSTRTLSRQVEVQAHADCGIKYREIQAQCNALIEWARALQ